MEINREEINLYLIHKNRIVQRDGLAFYIHYWEIKPDQRTNVLQKHPFYEVHYIVDGYGLYVEQGREYSLAPGTIVLTRPNRRHQIRSEQGMSIYFVSFEIMEERSDPLQVQSFNQLAATNRIVLVNAEDTPSLMLWHALHQQISRFQHLDHAIIQAIAHLLLMSFQQLFHHTEVPYRLQSYKPAALSLLHQIKLYIRDHLGQPLRMNEVASHFHISGRQLSRIFAEELNSHFTGYIVGERVFEAGRLLIETNLSIQQIVEQVGFGDTHYFSRVFKRHTGHSPSSYRKTMKQRNSLSTEEGN